MEFPAWNADRRLTWTTARTATTARAKDVRFAVESVLTCSLCTNALAGVGCNLAFTSHVIAPNLEAIHSCEFMMKTDTSVPATVK
jgi:hypothetical protein